VKPVLPPSWNGLRVALAHDWLTGMRGGERVLELLCQAFPEAPIYTLIHNRAAVSDTINRHPIHTSWLQRVPGIRRSYRLYLPFFPRAMERFRPAPADVLISTSHCVAKGIQPPAPTRHLCYCFTPMRYAWLFQEEYLGRNPLKRLLAAPLFARLRRWDRDTAGRVHRFVAISRHVQERIRRFYGRESDVVYPPAAVDFWTPGSAPREGRFDLIVSALVPYKRLDLAMRTYARLQRRLVVVGSGGERARLQALAGPETEFLGWQTDEQIRDLYRQARLLVFPGEEDYGIVPVEAQACGCPVVAFGRGGALETVMDGTSGVFFRDQTEEALAAAVTDAGARAWDAAAIRRHAEGFGEQRFINGLAPLVDGLARAARG
jgi:glycosyltransferase involved in cell wall biosynthesis